MKKIKKKNVPSVSMKNNFDFIETYDNALGNQLCDDIVEIFEQNKDFHYERSDYQKSENIDDISLNLIDLIKKDKSVVKYLEQINTTLRDYWRIYFEKYKETKVLDDPIFDPPVIKNYKVQRSDPGKGYFSWHFERLYGFEKYQKLNNTFIDPDVKKRFLVFTLYLNDIKEGGETEFFYQKQKVKPEKGKLLLFPTDYTYLHRGNPPASETKYIITGWYTTNFE